MNIIPVENGENPEKVSAMIRGRGMEEESYLFFVTRNGTVKRIEQTALRNIRSNGIRAITLDEGDELISVLSTNGHENIFIATKNGMAVCFEESDVRAMGRVAVGVRGIRLRDGDFVIGAGSSEQGGEVLTVTEKGYGKRTDLSEYAVHGRGGLGIKNYNCTDKTGLIADVKLVTGDEDLLVITDDGTIIRMAVDHISLLSRATQGVRLMRLIEGSRVISIECTEKNQAEENAEPVETDESEE